jgi:hypothetical protein
VISPAPFSHTQRSFVRLQAGVRALLLAPTRELATQIHREVERLSTGKKFRVGLLSKALAATAHARYEYHLFSEMMILLKSVQMGREPLGMCATGLGAAYRRCAYER